MGLQPDVQVAETLSAMLFQEQSHIIGDWVSLVRQAQPQVFGRMDAGSWASRVVHALGGLQRALQTPEHLRYPVLAPGEPSQVVRELAARAVEGVATSPDELHTVQGLYFLLQEALVHVAHTHFEGERQVQAVMLIDRFIKQLSIAMAEEVTKQRTHQLEGAIEERTWHLRELLRKEGEFLGFISHEVRTGLTAILGACDFLQEIHDEPLSETQERYVRLIERSGELIHILVNDILDYAKLESGRVQLRLEPLNMREVATDTVALLESKWAPKGLEMDLEIPADLPDVVGDRIRMQQIMLNLVSNAIRFSPEGGKVVLRGGQDGRSEWVEVEDQGPGVPEEDRTRIFERFEQLDNAHHRGEGSGLGLPIVKLLTELHGGRIEVLTPDHHDGGLFRVTLPTMEERKTA